jgi:thiol-disulfide isomerase/thioredoxin
MIPLRSQEEFETLWHPNNLSIHVKEPTVIYFTANWCGPCKRLDWESIRKAYPTQTFYLCDQDENDYTLGYLGGRSIPSFVILHPDRRITGPFTSSKAEDVKEWLMFNLGS